MRTTASERKSKRRLELLENCQFTRIWSVLSLWSATPITITIFLWNIVLMGLWRTYARRRRIPFLRSRSSISSTSWWMGTGFSGMPKFFIKTSSWKMFWSKMGFISLLILVFLFSTRALSTEILGRELYLTCQFRNWRKKTIMPPLRVMCIRWVLCSSSLLLVTILMSRVRRRSTGLISKNLRSILFTSDPISQVDFP